MPSPLLLIIVDMHTHTKNMVLSKDLGMTMDNSVNMKLLCQFRLISYVQLQCLKVMADL